MGSFDVGSFTTALGDFGSAATLFGGAAASGASAAGYGAEGKAYDEASAIALKNVTLTGVATDISKVQTERQINKVIGGSEADIAAAGLSEHGSALDVIRDSRKQGELQVQGLETQGLIQQQAFAQQSAAYAGEAKAAYANQDAALAQQAGQTAGGALKAVGGVISTVLSIAGLFCWVAREVYGEDDPRWLQFRAWMVHDAPLWFFNFYMAHGQAIAHFVRNKPCLKWLIRQWMNFIIRDRDHA